MVSGTLHLVKELSLDTVPMVLGILGEEEKRPGFSSPHSQELVPEPPAPPCR